MVLSDVGRARRRAPTGVSGRASRAARHRLPEGSEVLPREVYESAVRGLGTLVSPRAARRMVDASLKAASRTPDDVSVSAMQRLLLGRIRRELDGVLPDGALNAGLKRIATELSELGEPGEVRERGASAARRRGTGGRGDSLPAERAARERPARQGFAFFRRRAGRAGATEDAPAPKGTASEERTGSATDTPLSEALLDPATLTTPESVKRSSVYLPGLDVPEELRPVRRVEVDEATPPRAKRREGHAADRHGVPAKPEPLRPAHTRSLDEALAAAAVKSFAEVESVRQIVISKGVEVVQTRGAGVDATALAPLAVSTRQLLQRAGHLRVYSIERPGGVLFLFPLHDGTVTVLTQPNVNIGAVLAARAALEEAA